MFWLILAVVLFILAVVLLFVFRGQKDFYSDEPYLSERYKEMDRRGLIICKGKYRR